MHLGGAIVLDLDEAVSVSRVDTTRYIDDTITRYFALTSE